MPFQWQNPNREQHVGFDGTILPMTTKRASTACADHASGGSTMPVYGTKFTIGSIRGDGIPGSRIILDITHTGKDPLSGFPNEAAATKAMSLQLHERPCGATSHGEEWFGVRHRVHAKAREVARQYWTWPHWMRWRVCWTPTCGVGRPRAEILTNADTASRCPSFSADLSAIPRWD